MLGKRRNFTQCSRSSKLEKLQKLHTLQKPQDSNFIGKLQPMMIICHGQKVKLAIVLSPSNQLLVYIARSSFSLETGHMSHIHILLTCLCQESGTHTESVCHLTVGDHSHINDFCGTNGDRERVGLSSVWPLPFLTDLAWFWLFGYLVYHLLLLFCCCHRGSMLFSSYLIWVSNLTFSAQCSEKWWNCDSCNPCPITVSTNQQRGLP